MTRKASEHMWYRRPGSKLWCKPVADISTILEVPLPTVRAAYYGGPVGAGILAAAALRGFDILESFYPTTRSASPLSEEAEQRAEAARAKTAVSRLPMRLSDMPAGTKIDLLGRRAPDDVLGAYEGVYGVDVEGYGYAVTRVPADPQNFLVFSADQLEGELGRDGLVIYAGAPDAAYQVAERRFPGLKITDEMRERNLNLSQIQFFEDRYGVPWTD